MKISKTNLLLMAALLAVQTVARADDDMNKGDDNAKPARTWRQAAYDNRYGLAAGSAAVGLGALGYVYGQDMMAWFTSLSPAEKEKAQDLLEESIDQDLQNIEQQQENVAEQTDQLKNMTSTKKHSATEQKKIAVQEAVVITEEQAIAQAQQQVAQKQTWLQWMMGKGTGYVSENPEEKSSDDFHSDKISDQEKAEYEKQNYKNQEDQRLETYNSKLGTYNEEVLYPELSKAGNDQSRKNDLLEERDKFENQLLKEYLAPITITHAGAGPVNRVLSGDFREPAQAAQGAYQSIRNYFNLTTPAQEPKALGDAHQPAVNNDTANSDSDDSSSDNDFLSNSSGTSVPISSVRSADTSNNEVSLLVRNNAQSATTPMLLTDAPTNSQAPMTNNNGLGNDHQSTEASTQPTATDTTDAQIVANDASTNSQLTATNNNDLESQIAALNQLGSEHDADMVKFAARTAARKKV